MDEYQIEAADRRREIELEMGIREIQRRAGERVAATGWCLDCGEEVPSPRRWCDADCRDQWEKRETARRKAGR